MRHGPHLWGKTLGEALGVSDAQTLLLTSDNATLAVITYVNSSTGQRDATNPQASERGIRHPKFISMNRPRSIGHHGSTIDTLILLTEDAAASGVTVPLRLTVSADLRLTRRGHCRNGCK
jgi:hypothetical protein